MKRILKDILLERLPKKYHDRVDNLEYDIDLVDGCKYMLYYTDAYTDGDCSGSCYPVRSISEAVYFIKNCLFSVND